jgi:hypothetical protein
MKTSMEIRLMEAKKCSFERRLCGKGQLGESELAY